MTKKGGREKGFGKNISSHISRREPEHIERTISNVLAKEVMADVDMFSSRGNSVRLCNDACTLVVTENGKGVRNGKKGKVQEKFKPKSLFERIG